MRGGERYIGGRGANKGLTPGWGEGGAPSVVENRAAIWKTHRFSGIIIGGY